MNVLDAMHTDLIHVLVVLMVLSPALGFALLSSLRLSERPISERTIARVAMTLLTASLAASFGVAGYWVHGGGVSLDLHFGNWFEIPGYAFSLTALIDELALTMVIVTNVITLLVGRFSIRYLHREPGFFRFFLLLFLFATGMQILVLAGNFDLLFVGWEFVGISSFLLIAFFFKRPGPVRGAVRAFVTYRFTDIGLLTAGVLLHHFAGSSNFASAFGVHAWPTEVAHLTPAAATLVVAMLLLASSGKSALFPLSGWLARAMEGPTPSSALFYGALSIHGGVYLLLRAQPLIESSMAASILVGLVGALTAFTANLICRVQADAKSTLAYATVTQVGLMLVGIGLHLWHWVLLHMAAHAALRTFQLLRSPSALADAEFIRSTLGQDALSRDPWFSALFPKSFLGRLHHLARHRFFLDDVIDRFLVIPVMGAARFADRIERRWVALLSGLPPEDPTLPENVLDMSSTPTADLSEEAR